MHATTCWQVQAAVQQAGRIPAQVGACSPCACQGSAAKAGASSLLPLPLQAGSEALATLWSLSRLSMLQLSDVGVPLSARRLNAGLRHLR